MKIKIFKNKLVLFLVIISVFVIITGMVVGQDSTLVSDTVTSSSLVQETQLVESNNEAVVGEQIESGGFTLYSLIRGILGMSTILVLAYFLSSNRKKIAWRTVLGALSIQLLIAVLVLKVSAAQAVIGFIGKMFIKVLNFTEVGSVFMFGNLIDQENMGFMFAFQILPTIVFFSALSSILYYYGVIQIVVKGFAWFMTRLLKLSGAESLSATGNIFLGQTESPLLIKAYLDKMTKSEILLVMVGGMATIAGGVLAIYIKFLGGNDPVEQILFAKHLITASVMAAPGAIVLSKLLIPQTEKVSESVEVSKDKIGTNVLDAITNGTTDGVRLAVNVGAMLLVFIAFMALLNFVFLKIGDLTSLNSLIANITNNRYDTLSLQFILGYSMAPLMWLIGVPTPDITLVGQLLGEKIILNEFIAYTSLRDLMAAGAFTNQKSVIIATYILCGFANFSSIGIQLGGIGALAPSKRTMLSKLGFRALLGGALASVLSATIIGMILG